MKMPTSFAMALLGLTGALLVASNAAAQDATCNVPVFRGAAQPQGADGQMQVVNNGRSCGIRNYGNYPHIDSLAHAGAITVPPKNGTAKFEPPRAWYKPAPGFVGEDYFAYQANAYGPQGNPVFLQIRVKVVVTAP